MKSLELTEEQKTRLLEMCEKLFPDFYEIVFNNDFLKLEGNSEKDNPNLLLFFKKGEDAVEIHWFELCFTTLTKTLHDLYCEKNKTNLTSKDILMRTDAFTESPYKKIWKVLNLGVIKQHPVDYLYEQFKELTK